MSKDNPADQLRDIPLETIFWEEPTDITQDQIKNMAASFGVHGQIEPIVVTERNARGYRGVVGRLRYEGMKRLHKSQLEGKTIQAKIHRFRNELEIKFWQMAENLHRREISAMQRARQYRSLYEALKEDHGEEATIQSLAMSIEDMIGGKENIKTIQHYLSLTNLAPETQEVLTSEKMPLRYGLELLRIKNHQNQVKLAQGIKAIPNLASNVKELKWRVDAVLSDERRDKRGQTLKKKIEELRVKGQIAYAEGELSWKERDKIKDFKYGFTPMPEECGKCEKLGVMIQRNFHREPVCTDPACYDKKYKEKTEGEHRAQEEEQREWKEERIKVYQMEPDVRHWHLVLVGILGDWELGNLLEADRDDYGGRSDKQAYLWKKVQELDQEDCQKLLIRYALQRILTTPRHYDEDPWKIWAVKEFGLKKELFIREEE